MRPKLRSAVPRGLAWYQHGRRQDRTCSSDCVAQYRRSVYQPSVISAVDASVRYTLAPNSVLAPPHALVTTGHRIPRT
eukprot:3911246-Rhodomonas_salina.4